MEKVGKGLKWLAKVGKVPKSMGKYEEVFSRFPKCTEKEDAFRLLFTKRVNFRNCVKKRGRIVCGLRIKKYPKVPSASRGVPERSGKV